MLQSSERWPYSQFDKFAHIAKKEKPYITNAFLVLDRELTRTLEEALNYQHGKQMDNKTAFHCFDDAFNELVVEFFDDKTYFYRVVY